MPGNPDGASASRVPSTSPSPAVAPVWAPAHASGVELLGQAQGSGYREPPWLVRRGDGQTLQLTRLLYLVLEAIDGRRSLDDVAAAASDASGREVSADNVRTLIESRLLPLGLLRLPDGSEPEARKADPLLGIRLRRTVTDPARTNAITGPFARLFHPLIVVTVVAAFLVSCWWVLAVKGLGSATHDAFANPALLLLVLVVTVLSAGFHEFGHAAAARRGGATPGVMGMGLYLIWPAFFTDVTDSYRLGRGGRLRTDLGGLYFNAIVAVAIMGAWLATGFDALLLVVVIQVLQMVRQLLPLLRFDGYHILADLTGVPDLFQRIRPTLLGLLPWRWRHPETTALKPWARVVVTAWVLVTVPLLLISLLLMVLAMPRLVGTAWAGILDQQSRLAESLAGGDWLSVAARVGSIAVLALPLLAIGTMSVLLTRRLVTNLMQKTRGRPVQRSAALLAIGAVVAALAVAWWPAGDRYAPVQKYERGTLVDAVATLSSAQRPGLSAGWQGTAVTALPAESELGGRDEPQLAMILVPRDAPGGDAPAAMTWVFPFDRPLPAEEDGNQALAVNTEDGSIVYDVAFALVWAEDGPVDARNEAYAFASCTDCAAVAVGFQVVLILGQADVVVPENLSAAVTYGCVRCATYALASQLVLTIDGPLSEDATAAITELWQEIAAFGRDLRDVPLSEIQGRLEQYKARMVEIIERDAETRTETASETPGPETPTFETPAPEPTGRADQPTPAPRPSTETTPRPVPQPTTTSVPTPAPPPEDEEAAPPSTAPSAVPSPQPSPESTPIAP